LELFMLKFISGLPVILYKPNHINHWAIPVIFEIFYYFLV